MTRSLFLVQSVSHSCAFAYATANTALYAVLVLTVADYVSDALENRFNIPPDVALGSDIVAYVVVGVLLACLLVSNHVSYARRVGALFAVRDARRSKLSVRESLEKFVAIGGTYLKAVASTISLAQLISKFSGSEVAGISVAFPLFPFNAAAQFSVVGEQFSIRVLFFSLIALVEVCGVGAAAFGVAYGVDQDHHAVVIVMEVTSGCVLFAEMVCLVATDRSLFGHLFSCCCCWKKREESTAAPLLVDSVNFADENSASAEEKERIRARERRDFGFVDACS
jgi:hypothetical protein